MRVMFLLIAACSSMPDVNGNTLGESGHAVLSMTPGTQAVNANGADLTVANTGDHVSGVLGSRLIAGQTSAFRIAHSTCTVLQPGGTCTISIELTGNGVGTATIELDQDNAAETTAELATSIEPGIKWVEDAVAFSASDCSANGPGELLTQTIALKYADVDVKSVQITSSDPNNYRIVNNTCATASGTTGTCTVGVQVTRGTDQTMSPNSAMITATLPSVTPATMTIGYSLLKCELTLTPSPVELDAGHTENAFVLKNRSLNNHTIATATWMSSSTVTIVNGCTPGMVLAPNAKCDVTFRYTPSATPAFDGAVLPFTIDTADGLRLTGLVDVALNDNKIHFEDDDYPFGHAHPGTKLTETIQVLSDNGTDAPIAPLLTIISSSGTAFTIDGAATSTCNAPSIGMCQFGLDFNASGLLQPGEYFGLLTVKGPNGEVAYATLEGEVF